MNCGEVQQRLLEADLDDLGELTPHLATCPECAALVEAIRAAEADLDHQRQEFVMMTDTLDLQWARALEQVDDPPRSTWTGLTRVLLVLVAAAVVALSLWPSAPPPPEVPAANPLPPPLVDVREKRDAFDAIDMSPDLDGLPRQEQDVLLRGRLQGKTDAFLALQASAQAILDDPEAPARWRVEAQFELGSLHRAMGDAVEASTIPTYLTEMQSDFYAGKLRDRAVTQYEAAIEAYAEAEALARTSGLSRWANRARAASNEVEERLADDADATEP